MVPPRAANLSGRLSLLLAAVLLGCAGPQAKMIPLPSNIQHIALHPINNKTGQSGLEDALLSRTRDEFLRDGRYALVSEKDADAVLWIIITRYLTTPIQYDLNLVPTAYRMRIMTELQLHDKAKPDLILLEDKELEGVQLYSGTNETTAQSQIWDILAHDIVARLAEGSPAPVTEAPPSGKPLH